MRFYVMSLFPNLVTGALNDSIIARAQSKNIISIESFNIRDYTKDKHRRTDDYPYGGGLGMIMQAQPVFDCFTAVTRKAKRRPRLIYMSPHGTPFTQKKAHELTKYEDIAILCGHYEGIDRRIIDTIVDEEISIGDYILSGGELPAAVLIDAVSRLLEGTLKTSESYLDESFENGLLEYPQYTRPEEYEGMRIPEVLLSGNQADINKWRRRESIILTAKHRPDLIDKCELTAAEKRLFKKNIPEERTVFTITDGKLTARIKRMGAELCSLMKDGIEYLWQGDERYWNSQAPILFPVVARSRNGVIRIDGKDYPMPSHGFAKTQDFTVQAHSENSITLKIEDTPETLEIYPFSFRFLMTYTVENGALSITARVENIGDNKMWFTYGGHPGFNVPLRSGEGFEDYEIQLDDHGDDLTVPKMTEDMYIDFSERRSVCQGDKISLNRQLFSNDALIFENVHSCTMKSKISGCGVRFDMDDSFNYLAFWTRYPGEAPYVCIEPWIGLGKCADEGTLFRKRRGVLSLKSGGEFTCKYRITPISEK